MKIESLVALTLLSAGCRYRIDDTQRPTPRKNGDGNYNIIFITTDQERYLEKFPIGSNYRAREELRKMGTTFHRHYACSNVSTASRSVIYTGLHITQTGMLDNTNYNFQPNMDSSLTTVGDMMRRAGYYTAYKGKWHLSRNDTTLQPYGFADWGAGGDMHGEYNEGNEKDGIIANDACNWIESVGMAKNREGRSFFLAVNFINPHDVMYFNPDNNPSQLHTGAAPTDQLYKTTYPQEPLPTTWYEPVVRDGRVAAHGEYLENWNKMVGVVPGDVAGWSRFRDYYYNCIQDNDNQLKKILELLKERGLLENSIVILTADHGEMMGAHGLKGKAGFMYENNIHVPLVVYHPEYLGARDCYSVTSHLDLAPTFVDMTNYGQKSVITGSLRGESLMGLMSSPSDEHRNESGALFVFDMISMIDGDFQQSPYKIDIENRGFLRGIITKDYKFARYFSPIGFNSPQSIEELLGKNDIELFRVGTDESDNLAHGQKNIEEHRVLILGMNHKLNRIIEREIGVDDGGETNNYVGGIQNYAK